MVEQKKEIIYIPFWIEGMLARNNLPLSTVLDYRKMSQYLSAQEQANMFLFQDFDPFTEKVKDGRCVPAYGSCCEPRTHITEELPFHPLSTVWRKNVAESTDADDISLHQAIGHLDSLSWGEITANEIEMRFDPANCGRIAHNHPFITYDVEREFAIVVVYPAFFELGKYADNLFALCKAVLEVLYVYNSYASGCVTPYFRKYLEKLA
jgi:hypothetical protein